MLRPDHLAPHDLANKDHHDVARNAEELVRCGSGILGKDKKEAVEEIVRNTSHGGKGPKPEDRLPQDICGELGSSTETGLPTEMAAQRLADEGKNELEKPPKMGFFLLFLLQLTSFIIIMLIVAALASVLVTATNHKRRTDVIQYTTGIAIFILVGLNAGIAAYTEFIAGGALDALANMSQPEVDVVRDGEVTKVPTVDLVRGDVIILATGDVVPADIRLFEAADLKVSEMALTGEPYDVVKNTQIKKQTKLTPENMIFSGCPVANGTCKGIVWATGMDTRIGEIAKLMASGKDDSKKKGPCDCIPSTAENQTPMQEAIEKLGAQVAVLSLVVCLLVYVAGGLLNTVDPKESSSDRTSTWIYMILIAVTLAVAAIPEGIPLCVTISLALGASDMVKEMVQVRKIAAVETLGSASVICSDKTGTLTAGKMTMTEMWSAGVHYTISGKGFDPTTGVVTARDEQQASGTRNSDMGVQSTLLCAGLCSDTSMEKKTDEETGAIVWDYKGNASEAPIVVAGMKIGITDEVKKAYARILTVPFSSPRKMMLTVSDVSGKSELCEGGMQLPPGTNFLSVCKGAPNWILEGCSSWVLPDGTSAPMSDLEKKSVNDVVDAYSDDALRVLAVAVNPMQELPFDPTREDIDMDVKFKECKKTLTLVGLVASIDPEREGVMDSVMAARGAGIRVVMITGDYLKTAIAIAKKVKIIVEEDAIEVCATDCNGLRPGGTYVSQEDLDHITSQTRVFARAKPEDKLEIVKSLQRQGMVSAMTGDGVNDAPALNAADIGVAMGIQGTEVAKGAAEMILMDDNFTSIVRAVEKGRSIYAGIQKFVNFIMSVHLAEVIQILFCVFVKAPLMRTPLQILFLILVTDLPPSIALGMEPGEAGLLKQPPRPKKEPIVLPWMWISIVMNGVALSAIIICIYFWALIEYVDAWQIHEMNNMKDEMNSISTDSDAADTYINDRLIQARTVAFVALVLSENVRAYISRSFDKPVWVNTLANKNMQYAVVTAQAALLLAIFCPVLSDTILELDGTAIGWKGWLAALVAPVAVVIVCELCKKITAIQMKRYYATIRSDATAESEDEETSSDEAQTSGSDGL
jgi:potassium/sodium efflux P-type ATPase